MGARRLVGTKVDVGKRGEGGSIDRDATLAH